MGSKSRSEGKICPMCMPGGVLHNCDGERCGWWHNGMCDVSRIANALSPFTAVGVRLDSDGLHVERDGSECPTPTQDGDDAE